MLTLRIDEADQFTLNMASGTLYKSVTWDEGPPCHLCRLFTGIGFEPADAVRTNLLANWRDR